MNFEPQSIFKSLSPKLVAKAVQAFDRATAVVVGACWGAAILMMAFALYTVSLTASAKRAAEAAAASEPILPKPVRESLSVQDATQMVNRLQHSFPDINFALGTDKSLAVTATDGSKFREWLTTLSYIDTISPQYRWSIKEFCVGKCPGNALMHAVLIGEKISFKAPQPDDE